jgi:hypothetical protein
VVTIGSVRSPDTGQVADVRGGRTLAEESSLTGVGLL